MFENIVEITGTIIAPQALEGADLERTITEALGAYGIKVKALALAKPEE